MPLAIDRVELSIVRMDLVDAFHASSHTTRTLHHVLVRIDTADGATGHGECATLDDPYYMGETTETAWHVLARFLVPSVLGRTFDDPGALAAALDPVKGNTFAKVGLEMAAWDAFGRASGRPVADLLGGARAHIESGVSLGIERDRARLFARIERHVAEGYRRVKLKIAPGDDVATVAAVRERFPDLPLMVDANSAYTLADADHLRELDAFGLMMIEQPLAWDDIVDHAALQAKLATPICLDESIRSARHAAHALDLGSCRVINVKPARVGGLLEAKRVHDVCAARGAPVWCGGMHEFGVGRAANVALASLPGFGVPGDVSGFDKYFVEDIVDPPTVCRGGTIDVPRAPGLGFELRDDLVRARTERREIFDRRRN